jgi:O-antigen/teichoic acid export membrane protein
VDSLISFLNSRWKRLVGSQLGEILSHSKNYLAGNVATKALGLISMPVFTRLLTREDYGIVAVYTATIGLLGTISTLNATDGISRYYYEDSRKDFGVFLSSVLQLVAILQVPVVLALLMWGENIMRWLGLPSSLIFFVIIGLVYGVIMKIFRQVNISQKNSKEYVRLTVAQGYMGFGLSWAFVALLQGAGYFLRLAGLALTQILSGMWMIIRTWGYIQWGRLRWEHIRYSLHYSLPRLPYVLSGLILSQFDRIMLGNMAGVEQAGLYSAGYNVGGLSLLVVTAVTPAFIPNFYQLMNEGKNQLVDKLNKQLLWLICIAGIGLMLFGSVILRILADEEFHEGAVVIPAVVMGYLFYALAGVYNRYSGYYKMTILQSAGALLAGVINILLNYWWIPIYGILAAAYATTISFGVQAFVTWLFVEKMAPGHVSRINLFLLPMFIRLLVFGFFTLIFDT